MAYPVLFMTGCVFCRDIRDDATILDQCNMIFSLCIRRVLPNGKMPPNYYVVVVYKLGHVVINQ